MTEGNRRAILAALFANIGIALAKLAAWLATGAASLLAEAVHSFADVTNQALLLLGGVRAGREATPEHPFGYGRERYFWAFVVAIVLFLLGGLFAIAGGVEKLRHPHELVEPGWAIGVLLVGLVFEGFSFRTAIVESNKLRGSASWWSFVRRTKNPELPVVLLEDAGALLGLVIALGGVLLADLTGNSSWDALGSIGIGVLLTAISMVLAVEMKSLLIGESARARDQSAIRDALRAHPRVTRLLHMRTLHLGPEELLVAAKLELEPSLDFGGVARVLNELESAVRARLPSVGIMYLEPDLHDPGRAPPSGLGPIPTGGDPPSDGSVDSSQAGGDP
ncbi:MAG: cation transporter [Deltaproteobacteria bacterium]|nr:cation transporter [Deltaproteobacteria bacterium]